MIDTELKVFSLVDEVNVSQLKPKMFQFYSPFSWLYVDIFG